MRRQHLMLTAALIVATAWLASCAREDATQPTLPDVPAPSSDVAEQDLIPGQYIVVFKDDVGNPVRLANDLAAAHGLTLRHTYQHAIKGFSAKFPEAAEGAILQALQRNPNISYVEQDAYSYIDTHPRYHEIMAARSAVGMTAEAVAVAPFRPPANLTATARMGESTIDVSWTDRNGDEEGHELERSVDGGSFTLLADLGPNVENYPDMGLGPGEYCYRVRADRTKKGKNGGTQYTDYSNTDCAVIDGAPPPPPPPPPDPPAAPSDLQATTIDHQRIDLSWMDNSEPPDSEEEDGFRIERCGPNPEGTNCTDFPQEATTGNDETAYSDVNLTPEMEYCYRVWAFNAGGDSPQPSNTSCATTGAAPPPPPPPPPGQCNDNGGHDPQNDPGDYGITATQATFNNTWLGVLGNDPATCGIKAEFFGIDTGVDSNHSDLNVVEIKCFLAASPDCTGEDDHGHGTHTAGTAAAKDGNGGVVGMAPGAAIHGFKVCNSGGSCPNSDIIAGVDEVTARRNDPANDGTPMVANMSLGGGASNSIDTAVRRSVNAGVTYALSAGNGVFGVCFFPGDAQNASPARTGDDDINAADGSNGDTRRVNGVLTTTSHNSSFNDVNCNFGNPVTFAAPGSGIRSTWVGGGYNTISGTSMAAPHAAGAAMLYLQDGTDDPTTVEAAMCQRTLPWTTNDLPNAEGRLNVDGLGSDPVSADANQPTATSTCS